MALGTHAILFTDLVGSTELSVRVGPVLSEELRKEHFALLRTAGDDAGGREVKNLGDGLMLAFPTASAAVDAAVAAQQAIVARNRRSELRFEVRMGIGLGEVSEEDGDLFGEPVIQAARLCAVAHGGQILVTDLVRLLAGSSVHAFASVGPLSLKGLPDPVVAHEITWAPSLGAGMPLPMRLRGAPEVAYVGRAPERALLDDAWKEAMRGRSSLVLLAGEPGIGKTRLASHHAFAVHEDGGTVLYGAVDEGLGVPYQPWMEAIGHFVDHAPEALLQRYVDESGPELARLCPGLARRLPTLPSLASSDGETERYLLLEAMTQVLRAAAADNPVLVVLDDLHWADKPTLLMLTHLHRSLADAGVLFVATYRDSDLTPEHPLSDVLANLRREERVQRVDITGLDRHDIVELLQRSSGGAASGDAVAFARLLERDTAGNPLFVAELLRDLLESGGLQLSDDGVWGLTTAIDQLSAPASVRDVVTQRVLRLGADAQRVLATAAVIGRDFELELLAAVLDQPVDELLDVTDAAMAASLLTESGARAGGLRFIHALIAQALVDGLTGSRRAQLHRHIARTIEDRHGPDLGEHIGIVAHHLLAAGEAPEKTIDYARRAGQHAGAALAPDEALRWFRTALDLLERTAEDDPELRCDLLTDVGEAMRQAGQPGYRQELLSAARLADELRDGERCARAVLATSRSFAASMGTMDNELVALIEVALELCPEPDATRARLLALLGAELMLVASLEHRRALVDEALGIARTLDDETLALVVVSSLSALMNATTLGERRRLLAELRSLAGRVPNPLVRLFAASHGVWTAIEAADRADLDRSLVDLRAVCDASAQPLARWMGSVLECVVASIDGDLELAERHADNGFEVARVMEMEDGYTAWHAQIGGLRILDGRLGEVVSILEEVVAANPTLPMMRSMVARAFWLLGEEETAAEVLVEVMDQDPTSWSEHMGWIWALDHTGVVATRLHDRAAAAVVYELAARVPAVLDIAGAAVTDHVSTVLGMLAATLGHGTTADRHFQDAEAALAAFGAPLLLAGNRLEHGRALLALGDPADRERAEQLVRQAAATFSQRSCPVRVADCDRLLAGGA